MRLIGTSKKIFTGLTLFICFSCAREAYNISYDGVIADEEDSSPIPYSSVHSFCLFQQNIDESGTFNISTKTDSLGRFSLKFDKGYKISLAITSDHHIEKFLQFKPHNNHTPDTIFLKRRMVLQTSTAKSKKNLP